MYNEKSKNNLIKLNERTAEERTAIAKAGIKASIESKQEKKKFKDYFNSLLEEKKEIIRNGEKVKITKKEFIAYKLTETLTSEKELDYKDIQAIKLLLEIIEEKPIDNLINIQNNNNNGITIIDDCDKPQQANILDIKKFRYLMFEKELIYNKYDFLTKDLLIDSIITLQLQFAELRKSGKQNRINKILAEIQNEERQDEVLKQEDNFFKFLDKARNETADLNEQADIIFEDNEQLKELAKRYIKLKDWNEQEEQEDNI